MRKFDGSLINEIEELRLLGVSHKQIARQLGISTGSAFNYTKGLSLSREADLLLRNNEEKNWRMFSQKFAAPHQIRYPELSEDLAFVLGHLFFDGSVYASKANTNRYIAKYTNSSMELINRFNETVTRLFGILPSKLQRNPEKNVPWYETYFSSKELFNWLTKISPSFSTSKGAGVPSIIKSANKRIIGAFLQAFWDDEGCIDCKGRLTGSSMSETMIDDLVTLHQTIGVACKKYKGKAGRAHSIILKQNYENYLAFFESISFGKSIVKSGKNCKRYKQHVLIEKIQKWQAFKTIEPNKSY